MNKVGIIGGFGPETTSEFMLMIISMLKKVKPNTRPELLVWNSDMDEVIENNFITNNKNHIQMLSKLIKGAKLLEKSGADFLVLPCNSLHIFMNDVRKSVKIPVLSILDITTSHLKNTKISSVGILGTEVTIKSNIFHNSLLKNGINVITPNKPNQLKINNLITNLVTSKNITKKDFDESVINLKKEEQTIFYLHVQIYN